MALPVLGTVKRTLSGMLPDTADKVVDHFAYRFLSVKLADKDRNALIAFLRGKVGSNMIQPSEKLEESLRELLYLVLSTPEYQLG